MGGGILTGRKGREEKRTAAGRLLISGCSFRISTPRAIREGKKERSGGEKRQRREERKNFVAFLTS